MHGHAPITSIMAVMRGCIPGEEIVLLGAFQRSSDVTSTLALRRRSSGGAAVRIGPGMVWFQEPFTGIEPDKILNRTVRPLLAWLTKKTSRPVRYLARDWIAVEGRPVGIVAFSYESKTDRGLFEAFVSARALVTLAPRASYRGKEPLTLDVDPEKLVDAAVTFATAEVEDEPPWQATAEDAIGLVGAGRDRHGVMRVGGEFMGSSDVDHAAGENDPALFGASIATLAEVVARARGT
jgi:hypothetical protein